MKYALWFIDKRRELPGVWAATCNFNGTLFPYEEEEEKITHNKIAVVRDINIAYKMREYAERKFSNYNWEVKEWEIEKIK